MEQNYCERVWLNPKDHSATGSIVTFDGASSWGDERPDRALFVEVSDCHGKVRIHQGKFDTVEQFADKVALMRDTLDRFVDHLRR